MPENEPGEIARNFSLRLMVGMGNEGNIMLEATIKSHISQQQKEVLKEILLVGGLLAVAVIAPNAVRMLEPLTRSGREKTVYRVNRRRLLASLERQGMVRIEADTVSLTHDGRVYTQILVDVEGFQRPRRWDGKWRMVCFDIPEKQAVARRFLRQNLERLGFVLLQKSVYVFPYDCLSVVQSIVNHFAIGKYVSFGTITSLENDEHLRQYFDLK